MFSTKDGVLLEAANLREALGETLRHRYVEGRASEYYAECLNRLDALESIIRSTPEQADDRLFQLWVQIGNLSDLIGRIERSHVEEFAWPFAHALERTCAEICKSKDEDSGPLFFFMAEGGSAANYAVRLEDDEFDVMSRAIYSVIFPRTLKDHVLLHAILGHEIMHAAIFARYAEFAPIMDRLVENSVVASADKLYLWCQSNIGVQFEVSADFVEEQRLSWCQEFLCDLFGLIIMGPSFVAAFQAILGPARWVGDPQFVPTHPPYDSRLVALSHAARDLGMIYSEGKGQVLGNLTAGLDSELQIAVKNCESKYELLDKHAISEVIKLLLKMASGYTNLQYPTPEAEVMSGLVRSLTESVAPVLPFPPKVDGGRGLLESPSVVDFRHILHCGWIMLSQLTGGESARLFRSTTSSAHTRSCSKRESGCGRLVVQRFL